MKFPRRFSLRTLLLVMTLITVGIGIPMGYAQHRLIRLKALRADGLLVTLEPNPPLWIKRLGMTDTSPFFVEAAVAAQVDHVYGGVRMYRQSLPTSLTPEEAERVLIALRDETAALDVKSLRILVDYYDSPLFTSSEHRWSEHWWEDDTTERWQKLGVDHDLSVEVWLRSIYDYRGEPRLRSPLAH